MKHILSQTTLVLILISFPGSNTVIGQNQSRSRQGGQNWTAEEYSGSRSKKDLRTAFASKGFAWLSGSPADNEKLSIGKNSQFFGFVALRYHSGRAADRGRLGRAFFEIAGSGQRKLLAKAVLAEENALKVWWETRKVLLRQYETTSTPAFPRMNEQRQKSGPSFRSWARWLPSQKRRLSPPWKTL